MDGHWSDRPAKTRTGTRGVLDSPSGQHVRLSLAYQPVRCRARCRPPTRERDAEEAPPFKLQCRALVLAVPAPVSRAVRAGTRSYSPFWV